MAIMAEMMAGESAGIKIATIKGIMTAIIRTGTVTMTAPEPTTIIQTMVNKTTATIAANRMMVRRGVEITNKIIIVVLTKAKATTILFVQLKAMTTKGTKQKSHNHSTKKMLMI